MSNTVLVTSPIVSQEQFSELVGLSPDVIRAWINRGLIPTVKIGKRRLINVAKLTQEMMELEH